MPKIFSTEVGGFDIAEIFFRKDERRSGRPWRGNSSKFVRRQSSTLTSQSFGMNEQPRLDETACARLETANRYNYPAPFCISSSRAKGGSGESTLLHLRENTRGGLALGCASHGTHSTKQNDKRSPLPSDLFTRPHTPPT